MIALCVVSCKTTKETTNQSNDTAIATQNDVVETSTLDVQHNQSTTQQQDLQENETLEETITETIWSEPDSTGKQYPTTTKTTERRRTHDKNQETTTNHDSQKGVQATAQVIDKTVSDSTANSTAASELTEEIKTPAWVTWGVICVIGAVLIVVLFILKRYHII